MNRGSGDLARPPHQAIVLIVHWESPREILNCIATIPERRIVIVDNASSPESFRRLSTGVAASGRRDIEIVRAPANIGFGAGCNLACRHAMPHAPRLLFFLNPDTLLEPGSCEALESALREDPELVAVSPLVRRIDSDDIDFSGGDIDWNRGTATHRITPLPARRTGGKAGHGQQALTTATDFLTGAALMVQKDAFVSAGGFDESFFLYWEDVDLSLKLLRRGRIGVVGDASVRHSVSPHLGGNPLSHYYGVRNALFVVRRHHPFRIPLACFRYHRAAHAFESEGRSEDAAMVRRALADFRRGIRGAFREKPEGG